MVSLNSLLLFQIIFSVWIEGLKGQEIQSFVLYAESLLLRY